MMLSIKGKFKNGVAQPEEPVSGREGQSVIITFLDEEKTAEGSSETSWEALVQLVDDCAGEPGIADLAHQHDHYLHGKPKRVSDRD